MKEERRSFEINGNINVLRQEIENIKMKHENFTNKNITKNFTEWTQQLSRENRKESLNLKINQ